MGEDQEKEFVKRGKWYWKVEKNAEIKTELARFFFRVGKQQNEAKKTANLSPNFKEVSQVACRIRQDAIQAQILSVKKTRLTDLLKVFYLNKKPGKKVIFSWMLTKSQMFYLTLMLGT